MKKLTSFGAVAFAALIALLTLAAFQSPAQAYPEAQIDLRVDHQTVTSGDSFTATASSDVHCSWQLEWDHKVSKGESSSGSDFVTSFKAKPVKTTTEIPLNGSCTYDSDGQRTTQTRTIQITVEPKDSGSSSQVSPPGNASGTKGGQGAAAHGGGGSDLPNTGGPNRLFLAGGLVLLISGATAVTLARRRAEEAELRASRA